MAEWTEGKVPNKLLTPLQNKGDLRREAKEGQTCGNGYASPSSFGYNAYYI